MPFVAGYAGQEVSVSIPATETSTAWRVIATDGTQYADLAALTTAGKTAFPNLPTGGQNAAYLMATCDDGSNNIGSAFWIATKHGELTAPTYGFPVLPGQTYDVPGPIKAVIWVKKTVATDRITLVVGY